MMIVVMIVIQMLILKYSDYDVMRMQAPWLA